MRIIFLLHAVKVLDEVRVDTLKSSPGSRHRHKRKGRGISAGQGASCGFGMRGQKSRSGPGVRAGFEGGQTALYRRLPKLVGRPMGPGHTKKVSRCLSSEAESGVGVGEVVSHGGIHRARVTKFGCLGKSLQPLMKNKCNR